MKTTITIMPTHRMYDRRPPALRYARTARELLELHPSLTATVEPVLTLRAARAKNTDTGTIRMQVVLGERMAAKSLKDGIAPYTEVEKILSLALHHALVKRPTTTEADILGWRPSKITKLIEHQVVQILAEREVRRDNAIQRRAHGQRIHGTGWSGHIVRTLCFACKRVNAHGPSCGRHEENIVMLRVAALVPRHNASKAKWSEFMKFGAFHRTDRQNPE